MGVTMTISAKKMKLYLFLILGTTILFGQAQICKPVNFSKYITLKEKTTNPSMQKITNFVGHSVVSVADGFWICGLAYMKNNDIQFFYSKFNDTGKILFFKTAGSINKEAGYSLRMCATPSGGMVISGQIFEPSINTNLAAMISVDNAGNVKWYKKTPNANNNGKLDAFRGLLVENNGDIVCVGDAQQFSDLNYSRVLISKLDSNGKQLFINQIDFQISGNSTQAHPSGIQSTPNGYLITGRISSNPTPLILLVDKNNGKTKSAHFYESSAVCSTDKLIFSRSGKTYLMGFTEKFGTRDGFICAMDYPTGKIYWQKAISSNSGANDLFNHVYFDNEILYISLQTNELGRLRQGFLGIDTNGTIVSGTENAVYWGAKDFTTIHTGNDFDALKSGGSIFLGQDNGTTDAHLNFSIFNPCRDSSCTKNPNQYTAKNTDLILGNSLTYTDNFQGDLENVTPSVDNINMEIIINCRLQKDNNTELDYWLLNSFSPGKDGYNDIFKIGHKGRDFKYNIMIYNRWGELVHETQNASIKDQTKFWNGQVMNDGVDCPAGTYFVIYQLYLEGPSKSAKEIHGTVNLIK